MGILWRLTILTMLLGTAGAPALASAAGPVSVAPEHLTYDVTLTPSRPNRAGGSQFGTLQLTIYPDGVVQGYYLPQSSGSYTALTGGRGGDRLWFDVNGGSLHFTGTLKDRVISGTAYQGSMQFELTAKPH
jgi:hypothetical protein